MTFQSITPYLEYEDAGSMLDWLSRVFGFQERSRYVDKDGIVQQAEMLVGQTELWFGARGPGYWEQQGRRPSQYILVWVDDVDAMYQRVKDAGVLVEPPEDKDYGIRTIGVQDPEGYNWGFSRRLGTGYLQTLPLEAGGLEEVLPT
jgi:uncharacterized glyoxalase superfamily protein PhnB